MPAVKCLLKYLKRVCCDLDNILAATNINAFLNAIYVLLQCSLYFTAKITFMSFPCRKYECSVTHEVYDCYCS